MTESSSNQTPFRSVISVVIGSSLISFSPFFVEFSGLSAVGNSFYRMGIGGIALFCIAFFRKEKRLRSSSFWLCLLAALVISLDLITWNRSVLYIGSGLSTVLANLEIVFLVLIGTLFFGEKLLPSFFKMTALMIIGVCCLIYPYFTEIRLENTLGIICGLTASFIYSIYFLLLKIIRASNPAIATTSMLATICLSGAAILGSYMFLAPSETFAIPSLRSFGFLLGNGLLSQVLGWILITQGMQRISLSLSGILMITQPALTFIIDCLFLGRNTLWLQIAGCALLLAAVYGTTRAQKQKEVTT
jgi:drug/metabolite transporter (DMT)-like permease